MSNLKREDLINEVKSNAKPVAIIYSPMELHEYIVEIISIDSQQFIHQGKDPKHFHSIDEAISSATGLGAQNFFLCADNTYDECSASNEIQQFDYIPLHSKYK